MKISLKWQFKSREKTASRQVVSGWAHNSFCQLQNIHINICLVLAVNSGSEMVYVQNVSGKSIFWSSSNHKQIKFLLSSYIVLLFIYFIVVQARNTGM